MSDDQTFAYPTTMRDATIEIKRLRADRNAIIEECAVAAEGAHWIAYDPAVRNAFAAMIRAKKDKL